MDKVQLAQGVADALYEAEDALDDAMVRITRLVTAIVQARAGMGLASDAAGTAQTRAAHAVAVLAEARRDVMAAHADLSKTARGIGLETFAAGPWDKPDDEPAPTPTGLLDVIAA